MAALLSHRRSEDKVELRARPAVGATPSERTELPQELRVGWLPAAVLAALVALLAGWVLVAGLTVIGWLSADAGTFVGALGLGTQLWLLANGAGAHLGSLPVSLVPWAAVAVFALAFRRCAMFAADQSRSEAGANPVVIGITMATTYLMPVTAVAVLSGRQLDQLVGCLPVGVLLFVVATLGAARRLGVSPTEHWPVWARSLPRAVLSAQLVLAVAGAGLLTASLVLHWDRVVTLTEGLQAGSVGSALVLIAQLVYLPTVVVWSASYALGAGFTVGDGSVIAPAATQVGLLPGLPIAGALPDSGPGDTTQLFWLAAGVLAGAVAALWVVRSRPSARFDETALVGGLAGVLSGLVFVGVAWACSGDLGQLRLAGLGPRLTPLAVMAVTTLGLSGTLTGLLFGLLRLVVRPRARA